MSAQGMFEVGVGSKPGERNFWIGVLPGDDGQHASQGGLSQFGYGKVQPVNRRRNGTPYRLPKGTPSSGCIGLARVGPELSI